MPVWSLPDGVVLRQRVLQHPVCLIVVAADYARFYGVVTGLSRVDLSGRGWAFGVLLRPAAGRMLWRSPVATLTDRHVELHEVSAFDGARVVRQVTAVMAASPADPAAHRAAREVVEAALLPCLPVDADGLLVEEVVRAVGELDVSARVDELACAVGLSPRRLQRLTRDHLGLTPKWLLQRRRMHEAVERLKGGELRLADLAHDLGYADQAHLTRDFVRFAGQTPGAYLADQDGAGASG